MMFELIITHPFEFLDFPTDNDKNFKNKFKDLETA